VTAFGFEVSEVVSGCLRAFPSKPEQRILMHIAICLGRQTDITQRMKPFDMSEQITSRWIT